MNTVRIAVIAIWAAVGVSGYLSLRGTATDDAQAAPAQPAQVTQAQPRSFATTDQAVGRTAEHALDVHMPNPVSGPASESDTSDLTQPSRTPNQVFDALNADIGPEGEYVDPQALAAMLRSDPALGRLLNE